MFLGPALVLASVLVAYGALRLQSGRSRRAPVSGPVTGSVAAGAVAAPPRSSAPAAVPRLENLEALDPAVANAIRGATAAVERDPSSSGAWGELGIVYHAHRYFALAGRCYEEAWRLDPSAADWPHLLGILAEERGEVGEAASLYRASLERAPDHAAARYRLGNVLLEAGSVDQAARAYQDLATASPGEPWGLLGLGRVALRRGSVEDAARELERALELAPDNAQIAYLLAGAYRELDRKPEAARLAERARDGVRPTGPADPVLDRVRAGLRSLRSVVAAANQALDAGNARAAEALYSSVLSVDPDHYDALYNLGLLYGRQQRFAEAQQVLERALAARPASREARLLLALALGSQGRVERARAELETLLDADPEYAEARAMLEQLDR